MPDPIATDVHPAAPSAVASTASLAADPLETLSTEQLHDWRMTGAMPDPKTPTTPETTPAASSAAPVVQDPPASTEVHEEPASAAGTPRADPRATENRVPELLADRAEARQRAERAERRVAELEARSAPPPETRPAAPSAAAASGLVKPNPEDYPYGALDDTYLDALTEFKVQSTLATERTQVAEQAQQAQAREQQQRAIDAFNARADKARAAHADFDAVAMLAPTEIPHGSPADLLILEDEHGAEILYHLQQPEHAAERRRILALAPLAQLKALVRLGDTLTAGAGPARSTSAPPPPPTLTTRATVPDPVERALAQSGDDGTRAYMDSMNKRDLARMKR